MRTYFPLVLWPILYVCVVYGASAVARFETLQHTIASEFPFSVKFILFVNLPLEVLYNSTTLTGIFFLVNTALVATYITLLVFLIQRRVAQYKKAVGAAGSVLAILSIGCAACGSLITPALIAISGIVPLSLFGHINTFLSVLSTVLLLLALRFLVRHIQNR